MVYGYFHRYSSVKFWSRLSTGIVCSFTVFVLLVDFSVDQNRFVFSPLSVIQRSYYQTFSFYIKCLYCFVIVWYSDLMKISTGFLWRRLAVFRFTCFLRILQSLSNHTFEILEFLFLGRVICRNVLATVSMILLNIVTALFTPNLLHSKLANSKSVSRL